MNALLERETAAPAHASARAAQARWAATPLRERLAMVRRLRRLIAENAETLAEAAATVAERPVAEKLVSEVLPLADACRWLEREAAGVLKPKRLGRRGRPFWLQGSTFEIQRQPRGLVLIIGPGNYPLFLPAVQTLHALVAGNAVLLKPAPEAAEAAYAFGQLAFRVGLDTQLLTLLPVEISAVENAIDQGVDKVIFTGSSENGRKVLRQLAETNTPAAMELSGEDAVLVLVDADLDLVLRALRFGTRLNAGETCIAPRRVIVVNEIAERLAQSLADAGLCELLVERVRDDNAAVTLANESQFALGASVFSRDVKRAAALAAELKTGFVLINDLIVATADPRMPFGGVKASGFGSTRGAEGLLEMTFPHVVATRRGRFYPHFDEPAVDEAPLFASYIRAAHGGWAQRFHHTWQLFRALVKKSKDQKL